MAQRRFGTVLRDNAVHEMYDYNRENILRLASDQNENLNTN